MSALTRVSMRCRSVFACFCSSTDADLLPTRGPAKVYTPTGAPEFALLLTPGIGKGCNLKKFPNLRRFLKNDAKF